MDDLTYYGTLVCVILLQVSFLWLFHHDRRCQYLSRDRIPAKQMAIVIANYDQQLGRALKNRLETIGFCVYAIEFGCCEEQDAKILAEDCKIFMCKLTSCLQGVIACIEQDIKKNRYKFHACIDLRTPLRVEGEDLVSSLEESRNQIFWCICLAVQMAGFIKRTGAKLVIVCNETRTLDKCNELVGAIRTSVERYLHKWNDKCVEIKRNQSILSSNSIKGFVEQLVNDCLSQMNGTSKEKAETIPDVGLAEESCVVDRVEAELAQI